MAWISCSNRSKINLDSSFVNSDQKHKGLSDPALVILLMMAHLHQHIVKKLYRSMGYQIISNYGPYVNLPESVCMEKKL